MTRLTIAAGLILMLCATGLAQEREERERDNQDRPREKARGARERDNQDRSRSKVPGARRDRRKRVDWEAEYQKFLKENPGVKRAVENGRIAKEKVLAEIKDRAAEKAREAASEEEQILEREFQQLIKERPGLAEQIKAGEIKKEAVMQRLRIGRQRRRGPARDDQERPAARRGRAVGPAQVALRSKLGELVRAGKLTRAEAGELYQIAFPENVRRPARADRDGARDPEGDRDGARDGASRWRLGDVAVAAGIFLAAALLVKNYDGRYFSLKAFRKDLK